MKPTIRPERPEDQESIFALTKTAFEGRSYSSGTEQLIVDRLRAAGALTLSLVAEVEGQIVGHVALSPVTISDGSRNWFGLGPISVLPPFQRQGIGSALVHEGLAQLRAIGAIGCILLGDPAYYMRFGFTNDPQLVLEGVSPEFFMALRFVESSASGVVRFHQAFDSA